jgi:hypothetical protein
MSASQQLSAYVECHLDTINMNHHQVVAISSVDCPLLSHFGPSRQDIADLPRIEAQCSGLQRLQEIDLQHAVTAVRAHCDGQGGQMNFGDHATNKRDRI